jgi:hypothetical protein
MAGSVARAYPHKFIPPPYAARNRTQALRVVHGHIGCEHDIERIGDNCMQGG